MPLETRKEEETKSEIKRLKNNILDNKNNRENQ